MTTHLTRPVRDREGGNHSIGEVVTIKGVPRARSDFDHRLMVNVEFSDGRTGVVFREEISLGGITNDD